jgi:hypothetical protein
MVINLNYYLSDSEIGCPADIQQTQQSRVMLQKWLGHGILDHMFCATYPTAKEYHTS